jgi:hypothetical protein
MQLLRRVEMAVQDLTGIVLALSMLAVVVETAIVQALLLVLADLPLEAMAANLLAQVEMLRQLIEVAEAAAVLQPEALEVAVL